MTTQTQNNGKSNEVAQPIERTVIILGGKIQGTDFHQATSIRIKADTKNEIVQTAMAWADDNFKGAKSFEVGNSPAMTEGTYMPVIKSTVVGKKEYKKFSYKKLV